MNPEERRDLAAEGKKASDDALCQAAGFCRWYWAGEFSEREHLLHTRMTFHPDCPVHGDSS